MTTPITRSWLQIIAISIPLLINAGGVVWWAAETSKEVIILREEVNEMKVAQTTFRNDRFSDTDRTTRLETLMEAVIKSVDRLTVQLDRLEDRAL